MAATFTANKNNVYNDLLYMILTWICIIGPARTYSYLLEFIS